MTWDGVTPGVFRDERHQLSHPDWVVFGVTVPEGVLVFASTEMTYAEVRYQAVEMRPILVLDRVERVDFKYTLTADLKRFVMIMGATYAEAMTTLMEQWQPGEQHAIGGPR